MIGTVVYGRAAWFLMKTVMKVGRWKGSEGLCSIMFLTTFYTVSSPFSLQHSTTHFGLQKDNNCINQEEELVEI